MIMVEVQEKPHSLSVIHSSDCISIFASRFSGQSFDAISFSRSRLGNFSPSAFVDMNGEE